MIPFPVDDPALGKGTVMVKIGIDELILKQMSEETGGKYYRAENKEELEKKLQLVYETLLE